MDNKSLPRVVFASILVIAFLAFQDLTGFRMWKSLGGFAAEAYVKAEPLYMQQFWYFAFAILIAMSVVYYLLRKDKSEALAIFAVPYILLQGGMEDIIYYHFMNLPLDASMPWLYENCWFMSLTAKTMGLTTVTPTSLWVSFSLSVLAAIWVYKWLKRQPW